MTTLTGAPARFHKGLTQVGEGLWAWLQPNGGWGEANAGLIAGDGEALLIDTLWDERLAREMLEAMRAPLAGRPIRTVFNTHSDGDHWWGNGALPVTAQFATTEASREVMEEDPGPEELDRLRRIGGLAARVPGPLRPLGEYVRDMLAPFDFAGVTLRVPERTFSGEAHLGIGGREVRLIEVGPAHTRGDAIAHVPDAGVVFAADVIFAGATPVLWAGPVDGWLAALEKLLELDAQTYVPGHGPVGGRELVEEMRDYMTWLGQAVAREHAAGRSPEEAARGVVRDDEFRRWADWDCPERILITVTAIHRALDGKEPVGSAPVPRAKLFREVGRLRDELRA